jgi:hypothetical protein
MKHRTQSEEKELFIRNGFSAITKENLEDIYNRRYNRFKFDNSDEVKIDGIIQSKEEKILIKMSNYIIVPTPKEVFVSELLNGFEITEEEFIKNEIIILNNCQYDLLNLKNRLQFTFYKEYLNKRNSGTITEEKSQENKLTISEIALKYFYEGKIITRENAKKHLEGTGHNTGDKLYNEFCKWSNNTDRKAYPEGKVKLQNKIKLFKKVIALLPEDKNGKAKDELKILNSFISKYQ